jgi:hypothetical protein
LQDRELKGDIRKTHERRGEQDSNQNEQRQPTFHAFTLPARARDK